MRILGIDLGGTNIKYGVVENGRIIESSQCPTPSDRGYEETLSLLVNISRDILERYPDIDRIGLASPGIIDINAGIVNYSNNFNWHNVPICGDLKRSLGKKVRIANDAQCATLAEAIYGAGKDFSRVAMITIGTGVGGGFIVNKKLETDKYGSMAYIFGHMTIRHNGELCNCGKHGCLEAYSSASALLKMPNGTAHEGVSVIDLFELARNGDILACKIMDEFIGYLSTGVVNIANILRPHVIIIGGGVSGSADLILPSIKKVMQKDVYGYDYARVEIAKAELGNSAGLVGAASLYETERG